LISQALTSKKKHLSCFTPSPVGGRVRKREAGWTETPSGDLNQKQ